MGQQLDRFFIPRKIKVGYNKRSGTYTGKLGYVIYYDQKNVLRKERSWQSWREKELGENDYDNTPIDGFVLNKHAGGYKSDWNYRQSYCRVYDPRGFEFEITIDNLLWILDWEDCMHGKGLTGKFVYGWIADQLVLVPCCTEDYKVSQEYSDRMFNESNMKTSDLIPGASYKIKSESIPYVFIGNLKVQKLLGKGYTTKQFFVCVNSENSNNWKRKYATNESLYAINKSSILCKIADDVMPQEMIDEFIYRFNLTAYSYEFWHTENLIEKFIHYNGLSKKFDHENYYYGTDKTNYSKTTLISEDGKHVDIVKPYYYKQEVNTSYYYGTNYGTKIKGYYKFISLDTSMKIEKFNDMGKVVDTHSYWDKYQYRDEHNLYLDRDGETYNNLTFVTNRENYGNLYYVTKDGYISDSLQRLLWTECLSYKSQIPASEVNTILLPVKESELDLVEK